MALLVLKFGGTSVGTAERVQHVVKKIQAAIAEGHQVVVVLSAMTGQTDRLEELALAISDSPTPREMDVLLSTGEQITVALVAIGLEAAGLRARSYLGWQIPIETNAHYTKARIHQVKESVLQADITRGIIPVIAGFQGVDGSGNITTLGRGGSDTTAVAIAAALKADECRIYTDVDGVYTADPRMVSEAQRIPRITFEEMLELASLGSKVLQIRSVEFAGKYNVPLRVLSTFVDGQGTLITFEDNSVEQPLISGIAFNRNEAKLTLCDVPDIPGIAGKILGPIGDAHIDVDMIVQNIARDGRVDFTFTVHRRDYARTKALLDGIVSVIGAGAVIGDDRIAKVSVVGVGMRSHSGIASKIFSVLGKEGINIQLIATSEIKVSVIVDEKYLELSVRALHGGFELEYAPKEEEA